MLKWIKNIITGFPSWLFWLLTILLGLLILIFNDVFGERDGFIVFSLLYSIFLIVAVVRLLFQQVKSVLALKRDKTKMEMLHLKSQVNPHFFFNTLNNLYGLVDKDPKVAQTLILTLSDLMRYSIYEGQNETVTLEEEVEYLKNYIELQKIRYHKVVQIVFSAEIDKKGYKIMPLLYILLVENAFKHGVEKLRDGAFVNINLHAEDDKIDFSISNNYDLEDVSSHPKGIGLTNLQRRLEIGYKKRFDFAVSDQDGVFTAQLSLDTI